MNLVILMCPAPISVDTLGNYYHADEEVYIIYGDEDNYYDDSYETSFDGSFRFENLEKERIQYLFIRIVSPIRQAWLLSIKAILFMLNS